MGAHSSGSNAGAWVPLHYGGGASFSTCFSPCSAVGKRGLAGVPNARQSPTLPTCHYTTHTARGQHQTPMRTGVTRCLRYAVLQFPNLQACRHHPQNRNRSRDHHNQNMIEQSQTTHQMVPHTSPLPATSPEFPPAGWRCWQSTPL